MAKYSEKATPKEVRMTRETLAKVVSMLTSSKVAVEQYGSEAKVAYNGKTGEVEKIIIPQIPDECSKDFLLAVRGFVDHEVAHVLFTDPKTVYSYMGSNKKTTLNDTELFYWNLVEDCFVERQISQKFLGSRYNLSKVRSTVIEMHIQKYFDDVLKVPEAQELHFWNAIAVPAIRSFAGHEEMSTFMKDKWVYISGVKELLESIDLEEKLQKLSSTEDCILLAKEIAAVLHGKQPPKQNQQQSGDSGDEDDQSKDSNNNSKKSSKKSSKDKKDQNPSSNSSRSKPKKNEDEQDSDDDGSSSSQGSDEDQDSESEESSGSDSDGEDQDSESEESSDSGDADGDGDADADADADADGDGDGEETKQKDKNVLREDHLHGTILDENIASNALNFDGVLEKIVSEEAVTTQKASGYTPFTLELDTIQHLKNSSDYNNCKEYISAERIDEFHDMVTSMTGPITRQLSRAFFSANKKRWSKGKKKGVLSPSSLHRLNSGSDLVFKQRQDSQTVDSAVSLVVDCSGSMSGPPIKIAMIAAWAISSVLDRLKIENEILGFTTSYYMGDDIREKRIRMMEDIENTASFKKTFSRSVPIYMPIFKSFDEPFTTETRKLMTFYAEGYGNMSGNVDGESVRYAGDRLLTRKPTGKTMLVLSDGLPSGCHNDSVGRAHLLKTVKNLQDEGVNVVGVGIQSEHVNRFYDKFVVVQNIEQLPDFIIEEIRKAILRKK